MYTLSIERSDGAERYISHRGSLAEIAALAQLWLDVAVERRITAVHIYREGDPIETRCTGYQPG